MCYQTTMNANSIGQHSTTRTTITNVTYYSNDSYDEVMRRFRGKVPKLDVIRLRAATNAADITKVLEDANSPSGFVLFAEYNHAGWMRHFEAQAGPLKRAHRFTFGNPLYALPVLQGEIEAALRVPLDCCFIEDPDSHQTRIIFTLPTTMVETSDDRTNEALAEIEAKVYALVKDLQLQG